MPDDRREAKPLVVRAFWPIPCLTANAFAVAVVLFIAASLERHTSVLAQAGGVLAVVLTAAALISAVAHRGVTLTPGSEWLRAALEAVIAGT